MSKVPSVKEGQASARGPPRRGPAAAASREAGAPCAAPRGGGSRGGAPTEAFPVGERSAAPRERLPCAPGGSWASLRCPATRPHSGPRAPAPARLRAPRIRPRRFGHSPRSQPTPSSPPRRCHSGRRRRPQPAGCWEGWGCGRLAVGRGMHPAPRPGRGRSAPHPALLTGASPPNYVLRRAWTGRSRCSG